MGAACVARDEYARLARWLRFAAQIVEAFGQPLANLVDRPPRDLFHINRIGRKNSVCRRDQMIKRQIAIRHPFVFVQFVEFNIKTNQVAALARDD